MKKYLLGIDIGTSACKVAAFNKNGTVQAATSEGYPVYYPHPGWAEQNPDEWKRSVEKKYLSFVETCFSLLTLRQRLSGTGKICRR